MSKQEIEQLDKLIKIAFEADSPLSEWEQDFVKSLDKKRNLSLSERQADIFDRLVDKHC